MVAGHSLLVNIYYMAERVPLVEPDITDASDPEPTSPSSRVRVVVCCGTRFAACAGKGFAHLWETQDASLAYRLIDAEWRVPRVGHLPRDVGQNMIEARWLDSSTIAIVFLHRAGSDFDPAALRISTESNALIDVRVLR